MQLLFRFFIFSLLFLALRLDVKGQCLLANERQCNTVLSSEVEIYTDLGTTCAGFFISPSVIATNYKSVAGATKVLFRLNGSPTLYSVLGYVAKDSAKDLILLLVKGSHTSYIPFSVGKIEEKQLSFTTIDGKVFSIGEVSSLAWSPEVTTFRITSKVSPNRAGSVVVNRVGEILGQIPFSSSNSSYIYAARHIYILLKSITSKYYNLASLSKEVTAGQIQSSSLLYHIPESSNRDASGSIAVKNQNPFLQGSSVTGTSFPGKTVIAPANVSKPVPTVATKYNTYTQIVTPVKAPTKSALSQDVAVTTIANKTLDTSKNNSEDKRQGKLKVITRDYILAMDYYNRAILKDSLDAEAYFLRAVVKRAIGDTDGAFIDYSKTILLNPLYSNAYLNRGNLKVSRQDYYGAISDYSEAIRIAPEYARTYYNRANAKRLIHDYVGAIEDYTTAISLDPKDPNAKLNRGLLRYRLSDKVKGCADIGEASRLGNSKATQLLGEYCQ